MNEKERGGTLRTLYVGDNSIFNLEQTQAAVWIEQMRPFSILVVRNTVVASHRLRVCARISGVFPPLSADTFVMR